MNLYQNIKLRKKLIEFKELLKKSDDIKFIFEELMSIQLLSGQDNMEVKELTVQFFNKFKT